MFAAPEIDSGISPFEQPRGGRAHQRVISGCRDLPAYIGCFAQQVPAPSCRSPEDEVLVERIRQLHGLASSFRDHFVDPFGELSRRSRF